MATLIRDVWERTLGLVREKQFRVSYKKILKGCDFSLGKKDPPENIGALSYQKSIYTKKKKRKKYIVACMCG